MTNYELIVFILALLIVNTFFALCEFSIATSRKVKIQQLANEGNKKAIKVLEVIGKPSQFITVIQIGLNLVAIMSGVFAEQRITEFYIQLINFFHLDDSITHNIALILSILSITSIFIVFSELIPKKIAFSEPEKIACLIINPLNFVIKILSPFVWILSESSLLILKLLKIKSYRNEEVTFEEVSAIINEGMESGVFEKNEHQIIENVFNLTERGILTAITERNSIIYFDINEGQEEIVSKILEHPHARFLVCNEGIDNVLGFIESRDILKNILTDKKINFNKDNLKSSGLKPILTLPDSITLLDVLDKFRETRQDISCVVNEFGLLVGIITLSDVLATLMGDVVSLENEDSNIIKRDENSWIVDGRASIEEIKKILEWSEIDGEENYETISGFLMHYIKTVPKKSQKIIIKNIEFEIIDVEGFRIDDILVTRKTNELI